MYASHELGKRGEELAVQLLEEKGLKILARNWRSGRTELDIICTDDQFLIIVEVKTRSTERYGYASEAVGYKKTEDISRAAAVFQDKRNIPLEFRFDIVSVLFGANDFVRVEHIPAAFHP
jgi:putative endonuclease